MVLIASDCDIVRGYSQVILESDGWPIRQIYTVKQAEGTLRQLEWRRRVLLIDADLLTAPHREAWRMLVSSHPELPLVCLRSGDGEEVSEKADVPAPFPALVDPLDDAEMRRAVRRAFSRD